MSEVYTQGAHQCLVVLIIVSFLTGFCLPDFTAESGLCSDAVSQKKNSPHVRPHINRAWATMQNAPVETTTPYEVGHPPLRNLICNTSASGPVIVNGTPVEIT
jgi:hypothetical protein